MKVAATAIILGSGMNVGGSKSGTRDLAIGGVQLPVLRKRARKLFIPYYVDAGAGDSRLTWQAIAGVGYAFGRGEVIAAWRYLDYDFKSGRAIESLRLNGPAIGASFRW